MTGHINPRGFQSPFCTCIFWCISWIKTFWTWTWTWLHHLCLPTPPHSLTHSLIHSLTHSLTISPTHLPPIHSITRTQSHTHLTHSTPPTHPLTPSPDPTPPHPSPIPTHPHPTPTHPTYCSHSPSLPFSITLPHAPPSPSLPSPSSLSHSLLFTHSLTPPHTPHLTPPHLVFLKLFLRLLVVLSSSPLKILEGFCCAIQLFHLNDMLKEMISFVLLKNVSFAFIMDPKQIEYGTIFFSWGKVQW